MNTPKKIDLKYVFVFWAPLFTMWLLMALEGPFLTALIARLGEPKFNLAAYGVAFAFALILEAPVIMLMTATCALVKGRASFLKLRAFTFYLNLACTGAALIVLIPGVFNFITLRLIGLPNDVADLTYTATALLLPWPAAIGVRRFYQGILILDGKTKFVAFGTLVRLAAMSLTGFIGFLSGQMAGSSVGALALSIGVIAESIAIRFFVRHKIQVILGQGGEGDTSPSMKEISVFYYPLALQSLIALGLQPVITFSIGRCLMPLESLATWPVIGGLVFVFRCVGLSCNEVIIALMGNELQGYSVLKKFVQILAAIFFGLFALIAFTPLSGMWFSKLSGLTPELAEFSRVPLMLLVLIPPLSLYLCWKRSLCVVYKQTIYVTWVTIVEVVSTIGLLTVAVAVGNVTGVIAAAGALAIGRILGAFYLRQYGPRSFKT